MKILVCISNVPDTTTKINFNSGKELNTAGVQFIINPYDEIALTRALEIKESAGGTVTVINVGQANTEANVRKALAIGADDAIRINAEPTDSFFVASQIAELAKKNQYDLILAGRESIDFNSGLVPSLLAEMLGVPSVTGATKLDVTGNEATLERDVDGGKETLTVPLPFVASVQEGLAIPRIPNMRGIMTARTKPLQVAEPAGAEKLTQSVAFELPPAKKGCKMISPENTDELVELLHNEAKVI